MRGVAITTVFLALTGGAMAQSTQAPQQSVLSQRTLGIISPVRAAYERVRSEQASMPPPTSLAEKLIRLQASDQAGRAGLSGIEWKNIPGSEGQAAFDAVWEEIIRHDVENQAALKSMIPSDGWFKYSVVGRRAANAAFLVVQHAVNDPALMRSTLAKLEQYVREGEADGQSYALLYDRVALEFDNKPQRYGSQLKCINGVMTPHNLEDPDTVDHRRTSIGLKQTMKEYLAIFPGSCR
jgi:hypothetical protein